MVMPKLEFILYNVEIDNKVSDKYLLCFTDKVLAVGITEEFFKKRVNALLSNKLNPLKSLGEWIISQDYNVTNINQIGKSTNSNHVIKMMVTDQLLMGNSE